MFSTVIVQVALMEEFSFDVAVIFTVPALTPVTNPFSSTVAIFESEELQVTSWFALEGITVAFNS